VITVDKNAGIEYFDSPREKRSIYDAYVIDCIPEREDLGFLQLVTSTSKFSEVTNLLDVMLAEMDLSASPRNCEFLLNELKGLSGRLAIRLADYSPSAQELIALALVHYHCHSANQHDGPWLPLEEGFFVPLDDVPGFQRTGDDESDANHGNQRADLLYVIAPKRGVGLRFGFVEVKFRRHLSTARSPQLIDGILSQLRTSRHRFEAFFGDDNPNLERTIRRGWLARLLRFYADRGHRHHLSEEAHLRIIREIERMVRDGKTYSLFAADTNSLDRGFVFCPEYGAQQVSQIPAGASPDVWLFGPEGTLEGPSLRASSEPDLEVSGSGSSGSDIEVADTGQPNGRITNLIPEEAADPEPVQDSLPTIISFGKAAVSLEPVRWKLSVKSNPHLMLVGLPGMGKTTCLINTCRQLVGAGVTPIVFSYHEDIDEKLAHTLNANLQTVDFAGLGFNPMQVVGDQPTAYIDNVGMLRDIFAAIFPDLGEVQLGRLRNALKQSYLDQGWADIPHSATRGTPDFQNFFDILSNEPKPDPGLMLRLEELNDYGFFRGTSGAPSLLDNRVPTIIKIHGTQNENLQRAFSAFVLHNLYKSMFKRGVQAELTHAIIFDEAHRAAKLKLIPIMAKECRKYGISLIVASQETKDFDAALYSAVANYLALRLGEADAKVMAKVMGTSEQAKYLADRMKQMPKYQALFYGEGQTQAVHLKLDG
jgi:hypothetical protein